MPFCNTSYSFLITSHFKYSACKSSIWFLTRHIVISSATLSWRSSDFKNCPNRKILFGLYQYLFVYIAQHYTLFESAWNSWFLQENLIFWRIILYLLRMLMLIISDRTLSGSSNLHIFTYLPQPGPLDKNLACRKQLHNTHQTLSPPFFWIYSHCLGALHVTQYQAQSSNVAPMLGLVVHCAWYVLKSFRLVRWLLEPDQQNSTANGITKSMNSLCFQSISLFISVLLKLPFYFGELSTIEVLRFSAGSLDLFRNKEMRLTLQGMFLHSWIKSFEFDSVFHLCEKYICWQIRKITFLQNFR